MKSFKWNRNEEAENGEATVPQPGEDCCETCPNHGHALLAPIAMEKAPRNIQP